MELRALLQHRPKVSEGYFIRHEVELTGLPFWTGSRWIGSECFLDMCIMLTKSRARHFGCPVRPEEVPVAFRYCVAGPGTYKYTALYDRTNEMIKQRIPDNQFYAYEFFTTDGS
jgi:hypothetical protein